MITTEESLIAYYKDVATIAGERADAAEAKVKELQTAGEDLVRCLRAIGGTMALTIFEQEALSEWDRACEGDNNVA